MLIFVRTSFAIHSIRSKVSAELALAHVENHRVDAGVAVVANIAGDVFGAAHEAAAALGDFSSLSKSEPLSAT